jgi:hypothetical protein
MARGASRVGESIDRQIASTTLMNPLLLLTVLGSAGVGLVCWQQASIDRVHQDIARLSADLVATRQTLEADRTALAQARTKLRGLEDAARVSAAPSAGAASDELSPQREGWWPQNRPYFYLPKKYLSQVYFRRSHLPVKEVNAWLTQRERAVNSNIVSVTVQPDVHGEGVIDRQLFEQGKLNRDMAALLGMSETELERTDEVYAGLTRAVHEIEAARLERVDPPQPADTSIPGQLLIARLPQLSDETQPLLTAANEELQRLLGEDRAAVLAGQAKTWFDEFGGMLGAFPREFIRNRDMNMIIVQYRGPGGKFQSFHDFPMPASREAEYGYLFGPGAPGQVR